MQFLLDFPKKLREGGEEGHDRIEKMKRMQRKTKQNKTTKKTCVRKKYFERLIQQLTHSVSDLKLQSVLK